MAAKRAAMSEQIRRAAAASGMRQSALARAIGIDKAAASRFLAGQRGLRMVHLDKLAAVPGLEAVARRDHKREGGK